MRLALIIVQILLLSSAAFAETYKRIPSAHPPPDLAAAERAWKAAEQERDPKKAAPLWEAAGALFANAVASAGKLKGEAAYAAVLAWKNALALEPPVSSSKPGPLTARELSLMRSMEIYMPFATADEAVGITFLRGAMFNRHEMFDDSIPLFESIVTGSPEHETAEYAANMLLDGLNRQSKFDRLADWAAKMRATPKLLAKRPDLRDTVNRLHVTAQRKLAEGLEAKKDFAGCAGAYVAVARDVPKYERKDELLFNAGVCFESAGSHVDAKKAFREAAKLKTRLASAAKARADRLQ